MDDEDNGLVSFRVPIQQLCGKQVVLFSYGSGLASAMYSLRVTTKCNSGSPLELLMSSVSDIPSKLEQREVVDPAEFERIMKLREETHHIAPYVPQSGSNSLFPNTFYLVSVDDRHRRVYKQVPEIPEVVKTASNGIY